MSNNNLSARFLQINTRESECASTKILHMGCVVGGELTGGLHKDGSEELLEV